MYLHDTNQRYLFKNKNRSLSHGCVRVEEWQKLAFYIAKNDSIYNDNINSYNTDSLLQWLGEKTYRIVGIKKKLFPIILTIILGVISINKQGTFKHIELNKEIKESKVSSIDIKSLSEHELNYKEIKDGNNKEELLIINDSNPMLLDDIRVNPEKYMGRNLQISGFVCKETYLNKNEFIIGRNVMTCCAADSKVVGIIGKYDKSYELNENEKIIVNGTIVSSTIKDERNINHKVPVLIIEKLEIEGIK